MELIEERRRILLDTPHIETISTSAFKTDMIAPFKKLEARFEAEQSGSGDPSPDNVRPIEGRTDMVVRHIGKNLFDKGNPLVKNKYVSADGSITTSSAYQYSDYYTMVQPNTNYVFSGIIAITNAYNTISFYDNSKTFIGRHVPPKGKTGANFTTPSNCSYIRFNLGMDADLDTIQLEVGSEATEYESYTEPYYPLGKNLANPDTIIKGGYYSGSGAWSANTVSATTGLIRVKPNTTYVSSIFDNAGTRLNACVATLWNDADTCTGQITTQKFTTGSQTQFVRIRNFDAQGSYITNDDFKFQLEEGETPTAFEEYQGVGYIANWGKNLFDKDNYLSYRGYFSTSGDVATIVANNSHTIVYIPCKPNTTYTASRLRTDTNERFGISYSAEPPTSDLQIAPCVLATRAGTVGDKMSVTTTTDANAKYLLLWAWWTTSINPSDTLQIEEGAAATDYEAYIGEVYGGTVDLVSGVMTVDRAGIMLTESLPWGSYNLIPAGDRYRTYVNVTGKISETAGNYKPLCDKLTPVANAYPPAYGVSVNNLGNILVGMPTTVATKQDFLAWIAEQRPFVVYPLAEPYTIQLTPQQILTLKRYNTLMPEGTINEIKYWTHI